MIISPVSFSATYGGVTYNQGVEAYETSDGGFIIAATSAEGGVVTPMGSPSTDLMLIKTNVKGDVIWKKSYGGSYFDECGSVVVTDKGYLLLGSYSYKRTYGIISPDHDSTSMYAVMTDKEGNALWEKKYNTSRDSVHKTKGVSAVQAPDGFVLAGVAYEMPNDYIYNIKIDFNGDILLFPDLIGSPSYNDVKCIINSYSYDEYIFNTNTYFFNQRTPMLFNIKKNDIVLTHNIVRSNFDWNIVGPQASVSGKIIKSYDGNYVLTGTTENNDIFVLKVGPTLNKISMWYYGDPDYNERGIALENTEDGGYIIAGITNSPGIIGKAGASDNIYVFKIDANGNKVWERTFGNEGFDTVASIHQTSDGGYVLCGTLDIGNNGLGSPLSKSILLIKIDKDGN